MAVFPEYETYDAIGLADLVARRRISPVELLDAALDRIDRRNGAITAMVIDCRDLARRRLKERPPTGAFAGVPFMLKDLHALLKGTATTNGSRFWQSNVADHDSTLVERYEAAGLVIIGKTSTAELGLACETAPDLYGPVRNPWRLDRSAGGSSGGAAAAVAAGMLPAAHATDGGGSIRIPASCCGVFGLKPSRARNPYGPDFGEGWNGLAGPHAETISVRDSAALLDVAHGPAPGDPYGIAPPERPFLQEVGAPPGRLRIAFMTTDHGGDPIDPDCAQAVREAAALCATLGHQVEEARPRIDIEALKAATRVIVGCNTANSLRLRAKALGRPARPGDVEPITWAWAQEGEATSGAAYCGAVTTIHRIGRALGQFLERWDVLLTATFASPPLPLGTVDMMGASLDAYYATLRKHSAFTSLYNATGLPAASLPLHWTADGLPVGVQAAARYGAEAMLLRLCAQLEEARPWRGRRAYAALDATIAAGSSGTGGRP